jgi:hypothetical protein
MSTVRKVGIVIGIKLVYTARNANGYEIVITQSVSYSILAINKLD